MSPMVYRKKTVQLSINSFETALGCPLSADNEWVQLANQLPWSEWDEVYQLAFPSNLGRAGKPFRQLYGAQLIKQRTGLSDREVVDAIRDTPAYQYFLGFSEYQPVRPFDHVTLVYFRKRIAPISDQILNIMAKYTGKLLNEALPDKRVVITDATAFPVNVAYPQDTHLLNGTRLKLEADIKLMSNQLKLAPPRTRKREAKKQWVAFSRHPHRWGKQTHKQIKAQLQYIRRDLRFVDELLAQGGQLSERRLKVLSTVRKVYEQQDYMYRNHTHHVSDRIVSLTQPEIRPIVRGKAKQPVEFGPKVDLSITDGVVNIERFSFDSFNESTDFASTIDHYKDVHGVYPDEVLADTLYRTRANIKLCKDLGIKLSGPKLGRRPKHVDPAKRREEQDAENRRGEIEREFSLIKSKLGLGLVTAKTAETIAVTVDTGVVLANLKRVLSFFCVPISIFVEMDGVKLQIDYKMINLLSNLVA